MHVVHLHSISASYRRYASLDGLERTLICNSISLPSLGVRRCRQFLWTALELFAMCYNVLLWLYRSLGRIIRQVFDDCGLFKKVPLHHQVQVSDTQNPALLYNVIEKRGDLGCDQMGSSFLDERPNKHLVNLSKYPEPVLVRLPEHVIRDINMQNPWQSLLDEFCRLMPDPDTTLFQPQKIRLSTLTPQEHEINILKHNCALNCKIQRVLGLQEERLYVILSLVAKKLGIHVHDMETFETS